MLIAWLLSEKGYDITIFATAFSPNFTSYKAVAFWFPYHIRNDKRGLSGAGQAINITRHLPTLRTGIGMPQLTKVLRSGIEEEPYSRVGLFIFQNKSSVHCYCTCCYCNISFTFLNRYPFCFRSFINSSSRK